MRTRTKAWKEVTRTTGERGARGSLRQLCDVIAAWLRVRLGVDGIGWLEAERKMEPPPGLSRFWWWCFWLVHGGGWGLGWGLVGSV
eukprot:3411106-Prymnesium_polylepis.1